MIRRLSALVLMSALVSGCAFTPIQPSVDGLVGRHVDEAIAALGLPDEDSMLAGHRVIAWYRRGSPTVFDRASANGSYRCRVRVAVDAGMIIRTAEGDGRTNACAEFAERLAGVRRSTTADATSNKPGEVCASTPDRWSKHCLLRKTK